MAYIGFSALVQKIKRKPGITNPNAVAASIGMRKYKPKHGESLMAAVKRAKRPSARST